MVALTLVQDVLIIHNLSLVNESNEVDSLPFKSNEDSSDLEIIDT